MRITIPLHSLFTLLLLLLLAGCGDSISQLDRIKQRGELVVVTRNGPTTYYEGPDGPMGLEYELAKRFANTLGVKLRLVVPNNFSQILPAIEQGKADIAAAGLTVTQERSRRVRFSPSYQEIVQQVIYRSGGMQPEGIDDLQDGIFEVVAGSSHVERLQELRQDHPGLSWDENEELDSSELLYLTWEGLLDFTVADSNEFSQTRRFYPELYAAFDLSKPQRLAWALPLTGDDSLFEAVSRFFVTLKKSGELDQLLDRYYGHVERFDYVDTRTFIDQSRLNLPEFQPLFEKAAAEYGFDWRLLAAISYQESHWNPKAKSPTGVRGMMMLTLTTARQLGIDSRLDPEQSIMGGARYLRELVDRLPEGIREPDRTWIALASYNLGYGHVADAGVLTEQRNGNPTLWIEIKKSLPLLSKKRWYSQAAHGYARGRAAIHYVRNIRRYYDLLVKETTEPAPTEEWQELLTITPPTL